MKMEYLFTERAHLACPNMCFGIAASLGKTFDKERIEECMARRKQKSQTF